MSRHLKQNRPVSGVLFYKPPAGVIPPSDTRRPPGKAAKTRAYMINSIDEDAGPNLNPYSMFRTPPYEMQPPVRPTSSASLPISKPGAREPSPELEPPERLYLPILDVKVDVRVDGTVATTELKQSFHNPSEIVIPEAQHTFPLYDGAIVTSFECKIGESRVLRGVVKPKEEAKQTFEKAKKQNMEAAALLQELTPEIFETSLGNIPANTKVDVTLTYTHELKVVQVPLGTGLAVTLPTSIAPRYGNSSGMAIPSRVDEDSLEIVLRIVDNDHISVHDCYPESGHDVNFEGTTQVPQRTISNPAELMSLQTQPELVFTHTSKTAVLKKDFVFFIQMDDTFRLSSRAVLSPADDDGRAALMVSLRPSELFSNAVKPNSFAGEILFVLDRSGSMGWTVEGSNKLKINAMRDAMRLALSGVQDTCAYNIFSFGSEVYGMWAESHLCSTDAELKKAQEYVRHLRADMGGTEVLEAIRVAVNTRVQSRASTQIIILTDGEVQEEDNEPILDLVWKTRKELGDKVRFFTLGIGDMVSHRLLDTIAELGGGYCDVIDVVKRPHWEDRLNRMLRSAMGPDSWTCSVELGSGFRRQTLTDLSVRPDSESKTLSVPYIQAPHPIPPLHPHAYKSLFFMLDVKDRQVPDKVTIHTTTPGAKKKAQEVNVELSTSRTIHHLAAKAVLRATEDDIKRGTAETEPTRREAEALGVKYSITSRWTSFVAVADDEAEQQARDMDIYQSMFREMAIEDVLRLDTSDDESDIGSVSSDASSTLSSPLMIRAPPYPTPRRVFRDLGTVIPGGTDADVVSNCDRMVLSEGGYGTGGKFDASRNAKGGEGAGGNAHGNYISGTAEAIAVSKSERHRSRYRSDPDMGDEIQGLEYRERRIGKESHGERERFKNYFYKEEVVPSAEYVKRIEEPRDEDETAVEAGHSEKSKSSERSLSSERPPMIHVPPPPGTITPPLACQAPLVFNESPPPAEMAEKTTVIRDVSPTRSHTTSSDTDSSTSEGVVSRNSTRRARNSLDSLSPDRVLIQPREHEPRGVQGPEVRFSGVRGPQGIPGERGWPGERGCPGDRGWPGSRETADWGTPFGLDTEPDADSAAVWEEDESDVDSDVDSDEVSEVEETEPYQPSVDGPIMWTDAVGSQSGGLFVLPDILRAKLQQHFCKGVVDWMREELARFPAFSPLPDEKKVTLIDTLMMIIYFGTHLAVEEDYWYLIMDKAEDAVLLALDLDENEQDGLESEPFSAIKLSIEHIHFMKAQAEAQVERRNQDKVPAEGVAKTCPVCRESFGMPGGTDATPRGFVCLSDECYDIDGRKVWETWDSIWKHQVDCGHLLCSTGSLIDGED